MKTNTETSASKKVLFVGWGRSGKDEAAQFAERHLGLRYGGSFSWHAKEDVARALNIHPMTAWETRHERREFWKEFCDGLRQTDQCLLARRALKTGDIVAGLRDKAELAAAIEEKLFDHIIWVCRSATSPDATVTFTMEDVLEAGGSVIYNSGGLEEYHHKLILLFRSLRIPTVLSDYAISLVKKFSE